MLIFRTASDVRATPSNGPSKASIQADGLSELNGVADQMREDEQSNQYDSIDIDEIQRTACSQSQQNNYASFLFETIRI